MKQIEDHGSMSVLLPRVRLYREQVQDIIDTINNAELDVTISDGAFTFSDLDDLKRGTGDKAS